MRTSEKITQSELGKTLNIAKSTVFQEVICMREKISYSSPVNIHKLSKVARENEIYQKFILLNPGI